MASAMNTIPTWITAFQALLTPAIGVAVGLIAFLQWRTAHQKVVLDLFERRLRVYSLAREAVSKVIVSGEVNPDANVALGQALDGAIFLFGVDVRRYLSRLWEDFSRLHVANLDLSRGGGQKEAEARSKIFQRIDSFYIEAPEIFGRYLRMDQQLVRTPREWISERNEKRLSYADEKQI